MNSSSNKRLLRFIENRTSRNFLKPSFFSEKISIPFLRDDCKVLLLFYLLISVIELFLFFKFKLYDYVPNLWIFYIVGVLIICFGIFARNYIYKRHKDFLITIAEVMPSTRDYKKILRLFYLIYYNPFQIFLALAICVVTMFFHITIFINSPIIVLLFHSLFLIIPASFIAGIGIHMAISSCIFIFRFKGINISMNIFSPSKSLSIVKVTKLMVDFYILFTIELSLWVFIYIIFLFSVKNFNFTINIESNSFHILPIIFFSFYLIIMPLYFFIPQVIITKKVKIFKYKVLSDLEIKINQLQEKDLWKNIEKINILNNNYIKLINERNSPIAIGDFSKFFLSQIITVSIFILSKMDYIKFSFITDFINTTTSYLINYFK